MIIQFTVENFLSFKEPATLSLAASALKEKQTRSDEIVFELEGTNLSLLKSAVIYGANASGKSNLVKMIYNETNADVLELTLSEPYPEDYEETVERANAERDSGNFPEINTEIPDLSQYDWIFLGHQTWAMTLSNPIISFLGTNGELIDGKTIYPFSSNAGYGEGNSLQRMQEMLPNSMIEESFAVEDEAVVSSQNELAEWVAGQ